MTITPKPDARGAGGASIPSAPGHVDRAASGHQLSRGEILDLRSVLERAAQRAERARDTDLAAKLADEIANLDFELRTT